MKRHTTAKGVIGALALGLIVLGLVGCYTVLRHPSVAEEETISGTEPTTSGASCTDCHNNEYDHRWMYPHSWGFGYWGGYHPSYYYGYGSWRHYYWDPWWWGWGYYDPWPYYIPGGGQASPASPSPERPETRRALPPAPPNLSSPPAPMPSYTPPPQQSGDQQQQDDSSKSGERKGRRGRS